MKFIFGAQWRQRSRTSVGEKKTNEKKHTLQPITMERANSGEYRKLREIKKFGVAWRAQASILLECQGFSF